MKNIFFSLILVGKLSYSMDSGKVHDNVSGRNFYIKKRENKMDRILYYDEVTLIPIPTPQELIEETAEIRNARIDAILSAYNYTSEQTGQKSNTGK